MPVYKDIERGTWYFVTRIKLINGKTKQTKQRGFKTKKEAKEAEAKILLAKKNNLSRTTFREVVEHFLKEKKYELKETSYDRYAGCLNKHILPYFDKYPIAKITAKDISDWKNQQLEKKLSTKTGYLQFAILSSVFHHAIKYFDLTINPCSIVKNFKVEKKEMLFFTQEDFNEFISIIDDPRDKLLFYTLFYTGIRGGELLALQWKDIEDHIIHITKSVNFPSGKAKIGKPKSKASIRDIMIPDFLVEMLDDYKQSLINQISRFNDDFYVFGEVNFLYKETLYYRFKNYLENENISVPQMKLHGFRHSHASYLINVCNANIVLVANRLGHADQAETLNIYSHLYPSGQTDLIEQMNKNLKNVTKVLP